MPPSFGIQPKSCWIPNQECVATGRMRIRIGIATLPSCVTPNVLRRLPENLFMDEEDDCRFLLSPEGRRTIVAIHVASILQFSEEMKALVFIIIVLLLCAGCRSSRQESSVSLTDVQLDEWITSRMTHFHSGNKSVSLQRRDSTTVTIIEYNAPDSTGRQF